MAVRRSEDGKVRRTTMPREDPVKVVSRRNQIGKREREGVLHAGLPRNRSKVKLYSCVSMWKNQTSEIVPLKTRLAHDRSKDMLVGVNSRAFSELKDALDRAESHFADGGHENVG
jgi:hypothetical protein